MVRLYAPRSSMALKSARAPGASSRAASNFFAHPAQAYASRYGSFI
jgi:hypothetical protein